MALLFILHILCVFDKCHKDIFTHSDTQNSFLSKYLFISPFFILDPGNH